MDIFFADKPAGLTTHTSLNESERTHPLVDRFDGFKEHLEARLDLPLFVVHRLDRETTGAIAFAKTREAAARLNKLFESREVQKSYLFLTDRKPAFDSFTAESFIERRGNEFVSESVSGSISGRVSGSISGPESGSASAERTANARTRFTRLEESHGLQLWKAEPETGKPHQIRLHAADHGLPILGDTAHGGSEFPALCLHSASLGFPESSHESSAPIWYTRRELTQDRRLIRWLAAIDRRERCLRSYGDDESARDSHEGQPDHHDQRTLRWIHSEGDPLRVEQLGPIVWLSWYADKEPSPAEWESIRTLSELRGWTRWYLQVRGDRGRAPNEETVRLSSDDLPLRWTAEENALTFEFRRDSGLSPGLFLDQRRNRKWVLENSKQARVLNLFCYTGGFSVAAAKGGATQVVSIDVSKTFLDWSKTNFALNSLPLEGHEFRSIDSREYLAWAKKKGFEFDLIICDPPSFGRSKAGVFRIERDFEALLAQLLDVTAPRGRILFSMNFEGWDLADISARARRAIERHPTARKTKLEAAPVSDLDFELPRQQRNMKAFFLVRE